MKKVGKFLYQLFFTRDDDLDALQVLFAAIVIVSLNVVWVVSTAATVPQAVKIEALVTLRWMMGLLVLTAVPKWMTPIMAQVVAKGNVGLKKERNYEGYSSYGGYGSSENCEPEPNSEPPAETEHEGTS